MCSAECLSPHLGAAGKINRGVLCSQKRQKAESETLVGNKPIASTLPLAEDKVIVLVPLA